MRSGVSSRRIGWRNAGPASHPATAAKSGGKSNKVRAMRIRRRRMGPIQRYENEGTPVRAIVGASISKTPCVFVSVASKGVRASASLLFSHPKVEAFVPGRTVRDSESVRERMRTVKAKGTRIDDVELGARGTDPSEEMCSN